MIIIAIDPGSSSGAIAAYATDKESAMISNMPETPLEIYRHLKMLAAGGCECLIEDVGTTRPGNSAQSAHTFAVHQGHLEMACVALGIHFKKVRPQKWMATLFGKDYPSGQENYKQRKQYIHDKMCKLYPTWKFTKRQADAVAILTFALKHCTI